MLAPKSTGLALRQRRIIFAASGATWSVNTVPPLTQSSAARSSPRKRSSITSCKPLWLPIQARLRGHGGGGGDRYRRHGASVRKVSPDRRPPFEGPSALDANLLDLTSPLEPALPVAGGISPFGNAGPGTPVMRSLQHRVDSLTLHIGGCGLHLRFNAEPGSRGSRPSRLIDNTKS